MIISRSAFILRRSGHMLARHQQRTSSSVPKVAKADTGTGAGSSSFFWTMWERYTALLFARPLIVKATSASVIFFVSDSATQLITEPDSDWDVARAGSGAAFGIVATGWLHYWWGFLEGFVGRRVPVAQNRLGNTLVKVVLDQAIGAPLYIYTYYVITNFVQEMSNRPVDSDKESGDVLKDTCERASEMLAPTMLRHWTLWPAVHTLNFYYSPLHHRVLVQNLVLIGWSGCEYRQ
jgi:protein Mpv17